jgi:hypothetical protein
MKFIVVFEELHNWFISLEELQTFQAKTIQIVVNFDYGFGSTVRKGTLFHLTQSDAVIFKVELWIENPHHMLWVQQGSQCKY